MSYQGDAVPAARKPPKWSLNPRGTITFVLNVIALASESADSEGVVERTGGLSFNFGGFGFTR
jgi:hypothetical protein